jgi:hypothetical protein
MHFLFDAQMPVKLAEGIAILDQENRHGEIKIQVSHADNLLGKGATDEQVIHKASEIDAIIFSQDDDFKRIKTNKALIKQLGLGYVLYKPPQRGSRYWEISVSVVLAWEDLKEKINSIQKPFILKINRKGEILTESF